MNVTQLRISKVHKTGSVCLMIVVIGESPYNGSSSQAANKTFYLPVNLHYNYFLWPTQIIRDPIFCAIFVLHILSAEYYIYLINFSSLVTFSPHK